VTFGAPGSRAYDKAYIGKQHLGAIGYEVSAIRYEALDDVKRVNGVKVLKGVNGLIADSR
jgi:hypothetical protein